MTEQKKPPRWRGEANNYLLNVIGRLPEAERGAFCRLALDKECREGLTQVMLLAGREYLGDTQERVAGLMIGMVGMALCWGACVAAEEGRTDGDEGTATAGESGGGPSLPPS